MNPDPDTPIVQGLTPSLTRNDLKEFNDRCERAGDVFAFSYRASRACLMLLDRIVMLEETVDGDRAYHGKLLDEKDKILNKILARGCVDTKLVYVPNTSSEPPFHTMENWSCLKQKANTPFRDGKGSTTLEIITMCPVCEAEEALS